jgi:restriction system protein
MSRHRSGLTADDREGLALVLLVIGPMIYARVRAVDWHWWVVTVVFAATAGLLMVRSFARAARRRQRERLMADDVRRLPWRDFESYVQALLQDIGWQQVEVTGGAGDRGVDLRATYNGEPWIVQCKHRKSDRQPLAPSIARDVLGTLSEETKRGRAKHALLVTTGRFGPGSRNLERTTELELWDGTELARKRLEADARMQRRSPNDRRTTRRLWTGFMLINAAAVLWAIASVYQIHVTFR